MARISPYAFVQEFDNNGEPLAGGKINTYEAGTTTPKVTYTSEDESTANANPIILDASGRADIWLDTGTYKFVLTDSSDNLIKEVDNISGGVSGDIVTYVISTNTSITAVYKNARIYASGTVTLSLLAAATAEDGFEFLVKNVGSNNVTIDPDGAETIDGNSTLVLTAGEWARISCDGTQWRSFLNEDSTEFLDSVFRIQDDGDTTKQIAFEASGITTATTRTLTVQDADGTIAYSADVPPVLTDYIGGLILSNDTDTDYDINITAGVASDSANAKYLNLTSEITKQIDATWAEGNDAGGLFTGTVATSTWYHVFIIEKDSDGTIDAGFDTSVTAANIPSGYTAYRYTGSVLTDGSANIIAFRQIDNFIYWDAQATDVAGTTSTSAANVALRTPLGFKVKTLITGAFQDAPASGASVLFTDPDQSDTATSLSTGIASFVGNTSDTGAQISVVTNTSSQVRWRASVGAEAFDISTVGWERPN